MVLINFLVKSIYWIQVVEDSNCKVLLFKGVEELTFVEDWVENYIERTYYGIKLTYRVHYLTDTFEIKRPIIHQFVKFLDDKLEAEVKLTDENSAEFQIEYLTKCESEDRNLNLKEIDDFKTDLELILKAISIDTDCGLLLFSEHLHHPTSFWETGPWTLNPDIKEESIALLIDKMKAHPSELKSFNTLTTLNNMTSAQAQLIYGFESIKKILDERVKSKLTSLFNLPKDQTMYLCDNLISALEDRFKEKGIALDTEQKTRLKSDLNKTLNGTTPKYSLALIQCLKDILSDESNYVDTAYKNLEKLRHQTAHASNKIVNKEELITSLGFIRKVLKELSNS